jgi:hypothetical protein
MRIHGFPYYFSLASPPESTDIVTQLWELFSYGIPLCYIFDQLPDQAGFNKINNSEFDPEQYETNPDRAKKRAIALFVMQIHTPKVEQTIPGCELFTVTDLWDRNSTNGLVKVRLIFIRQRYHAVRLMFEMLGNQHSDRDSQLFALRCLRPVSSSVPHLLTRCL